MVTGCAERPRDARSDRLAEKVTGQRLFKNVSINYVFSKELPFDQNSKQFLSVFSGAKGEFKRCV